MSGYIFRMSGRTLTFLKPFVLQGVYIAEFETPL